MKSIYNQYKTKPKKPYTGPPRPNLMSHDKTIRGMNDTVAVMQSKIAHQQQELERMGIRFRQALADIAQLNQRLSKK